MKKVLSPLASAVFATDPRVLGRARVKFEVEPADEHEKLIAAVERLKESAKGGQEPEATWLAEAEGLGDRVGRHWRDVPASVVAELIKTASPLVPLGFPVTCVPCCATETFETVVDETYKPLRLVIDAAAASRVSVRAIVAGLDHCVANREPLPGTLFSPDAFPFRLFMKTLHAGTIVRVELVNHSAADAYVSMCLLGLTIESIGGGVPPRPPW